MNQTDSDSWMHKINRIEFNHTAFEHLEDLEKAADSLIGRRNRFETECSDLAKWNIKIEAKRKISLTHYAKKDLEKSLEAWSVVFKWKNLFVKTPAFAKIWEARPRSEKRPELRKLTLFRGGWGHIAVKKDQYCKSRVFIEKDGSMFYESWRGGMECPLIHLKNPSETVRILSRKYAEAIIDDLKTGVVFMTLRQFVAESSLILDDLEEKERNPPVMRFPMMTIVGRKGKGK